MLTRFKASLILAPVFLLLLCWIGCFGGAEQVSRVGIVPFLLWATVGAIAMAYLITLYVSFVSQAMFKR